MNIFEDLGIILEKIDPKAKEIATEVTHCTILIEKALNSSVAVDLETIVPQIGEIRAEVMNLCEIAIKACAAIQSFDPAGVSGRLLRLGTDWTMLAHGKHSFADYSIIFQKVFKDITGK